MKKCNKTVKTLRLRAGLSQNALARLSVSRSVTISNAERGLDVSDLTLSKIATALSNRLEQEIDAEQLEDNTTT